jgi:anti-anti-sigma factor
MLDDDTAVALVALSGEYDISRTAELRDSILMKHSDEPMVEVDMSEVSFLDSSALRAMLEVHGVLAQQGVSMTLSNASLPVRRLLAVVGMSEVFGVE